MQKGFVNDGLKHLLFFVFVELLFVFVLFREFPSVDLFTAIGLGHTTYWLIVLVAGFFRQKVVVVWQKFLLTYLPVVYHFVIHIWIGVETFEHVSDHSHEHEFRWMLMSVAVLGVLIFLGEYRLHRTRHCVTHHATLHDHCHDEDCESSHEH